MGCSSSVIRGGPNEPLDIRALVASIPPVQVCKRRWTKNISHIKPPKKVKKAPPPTSTTKLEGAPNDFMRGLHTPRPPAARAPSLNVLFNSTSIIISSALGDIVGYFFHVHYDAATPNPLFSNIYICIIQGAAGSGKLPMEPQAS